MSKYSALSPITGKREDLVWRKAPHAKWWILHHGEKRIGWASNESGSWWCCAFAPATDLKGLRSIYGLKTRRDAMNYLLRVAGIWE